MKALVLNRNASESGMVIIDLDEPQIGPGLVLVRIRAASINFHDLAVISGQLQAPEGRVLLSDAAGYVVAVGEGVERFRVGDRVISRFFPNWLSGPATSEQLGGVPGDHVDGVAAEYVSFHEQAVTLLPKHMSFEEAACLPCAGVTAWQAVMDVIGARPGTSLLIQGSGGVSVFALQLAKAAGATVIATSSTNEKCEKLRALGADHTINYLDNPEWGKLAKQCTGGRGVDGVVEVGGPGTLAQSIAACRMGGEIAMIGVLTGREGVIPTADFFRANLRMTGITVGSAQHQGALVRATETAHLKPVIDSVFPLAEAKAAVSHQLRQKHFGKIVISI